MPNDAEIELEVTPTGRIRTIYKDGRQELLQSLASHWRIKRASNVEWEEGREYTGWTVRSAHDQTLAIRAIIKDGRFSRVVSREGELLYFVSREAALEAELDHFWKLLPPDTQPPTPEVTILTKKEFEDLMEYSTTIPTGMTIGKRWKRDMNVLGVHSKPAEPRWWMGEYVDSCDLASTGRVGIKWTRIIIKETP